MPYHAYVEKSVKQKGWEDDLLRTYSLLGKKFIALITHGPNGGKRIDYLNEWEHRKERRKKSNILTIPDLSRAANLRRGRSKEEKRNRGYCTAHRAPKRQVS